MRAVVTGAGGFLGSHLVIRLKDRGYWVRGVDLHRPSFSETAADDFVIADLRDRRQAMESIDACDPAEVYAFAADMGGMGYISFHDADILSSNLAISLNTVEATASGCRTRKLIYASSACVYPDYRQTNSLSPALAEDDAYPADPQDGYGWEKLTTEKLITAFHGEGRLEARIARFHNIYGPQGTWDGGREKAPAALCRKIAQAQDGASIDVWGDGMQTRSFCYVNDAITGTIKLADSSYPRPLNIGSDERVTINELASIVSRVAGKNISLNHIPGPEGVRGRSSDNTRVASVLGWAPVVPLETGLGPTYDWVAAQVVKAL